MVRNVEIKVRCPDLDRVRQLAGELGTEYQWTHRDVDTYFRVSRGRLKLRETSGSSTGTLIAYDRPDQAESRISGYQLLDTGEPATLRAMLSDTVGVLTTVKKIRELYLFGHTRIHLDAVDGLGTFVELETVLREQAIVEAEMEHRHVKTALGLDVLDVVPFGYSDLILGNK